MIQMKAARTPVAHIALALGAAALPVAPAALAAEPMSAEAQRALLDKAWDLGMAKNWTAEVQIYESLAQIGNAEAQRRLANAYQYGNGVEKDREKSRQLMMISARSGYSRAMLELGMIYGEDHSYVQAIKWSVIATSVDPGISKNDLLYSELKSIEVSREMVSPSEIAEAERLARIEVIPIQLRHLVSGKPKDMAVDILMSRLTSAMKDGRYADAIPVFTVLEEQGTPLPESFYFYQADALMRSGDKAGAQAKADAFITKYGKGSTHYARMIEILAQ